MTHPNLENFLLSEVCEAIINRGAIALFVMESMSKMSNFDLRLLERNTSCSAPNGYTRLISKLADFFRFLGWA